MSMPSRLLSASHRALRIAPFVTPSTTFMTRPATRPPTITRPTLMPAIHSPFPSLTQSSYRIVDARATYTIARLGMMLTTPTPRRAMLKATGLAALGAGLSACAGRRGGSLTWPEPPRRFARVHVSEDRIIRTVVGLRPFRPSGFVVRTEKLGETTVVHNYGHGGGGITLSWGTSELAVDEAWKTGEKPFAVLRCRAVGLATARLLQQRRAEGTIYAKALPPHTTSNIAGGQWSPTSVMAPDRRTPESDALLTRASPLSHRSFQRL